MSDASTRSFEDFFTWAEPRLRAAFSASYGVDLGRECTAEALAWAYEHWDRVGPMSHPIGYLYRVGQSRSRRLRRRVPAIVERSTEPVADFEPNLAAALAALPRRQRTAVTLVHGYGYTQVEVAELLDVKPSSVSTHVARGLAALRTKLGVDDV